MVGLMPRFRSFERVTFDFGKGSSFSRNRLFSSRRDNPRAHAMNTTSQPTHGLAPPLQHDPIHDNVAQPSSYQKGPSSEYAHEGFSPGHETGRSFTPGGHAMDTSHSSGRYRRQIVSVVEFC